MLLNKCTRKDILRQIKLNIIILKQWKETKKLFTLVIYVEKLRI